MTDTRDVTIQELFSLFDLDNSGHISLDELKQVGPVFNPNWANEAVCTAAFNDMDLDHNGKVSEEEFKAFIINHTKDMSDSQFNMFALTTSRMIRGVRVLNPVPVPEEVSSAEQRLAKAQQRKEVALELFNLFDLDHNGSLSPEELKEVGPVFFPSWQDAAVCEQAFQDMDKDHNGNISDDEFVAFFLGHTYDMEDGQFEIFALSVERMIKALTPPTSEEAVDDGLVFESDLPDVVVERRKSEVRKLFGLFDLDKNGHISLDELKEVGPVFNPAWSNAEVCTAAFNDMDLDHNGKVSEQEFITFMANHTKEMGCGDFNRFALTTERLIRAITA